MVSIVKYLLKCFKNKATVLKLCKQNMKIFTTKKEFINYAKKKVNSTQNSMLLILTLI
jgi:hypothetical protein